MGLVRNDHLDEIRPHWRLPRHRTGPTPMNLVALAFCAAVFAAATGDDID